MVCCIHITLLFLVLGWEVELAVIWIYSMNSSDKIWVCKEGRFETKGTTRVTRLFMTIKTFKLQDF